MRNTSRVVLAYVAMIMMIMVILYVVMKAVMMVFGTEILEEVGGAEGIVVVEVEGIVVVEADGIVVVEGIVVEEDAVTTKCGLIYNKTMKYI